MKVIVITQVGTGDTIEIAVKNTEVVGVAKILKGSPAVKHFYVDGMNVRDQAKAFGVCGFDKWISPIQQ